MLEIRENVYTMRYTFEPFCALLDNASSSNEKYIKHLHTDAILRNFRSRSAESRISPRTSANFRITQYGGVVLHYSNTIEFHFQFQFNMTSRRPCENQQRAISHKVRNTGKHGFLRFAAFFLIFFFLKK